MKTLNMNAQNSSHLLTKVKEGIKKISVFMFLSLFGFFPLNAQNPDCGTDFTFDNSGGLTVNFTGTSFGNVAFYAWNFGDDTAWVPGSLNMTHTYQTDGIYNVCFWGYDNTFQVCMGNSEYCHPVVVGNPDTNCTATSAFWLMPDGMITFTNNNSYGNYDSQLWDFGDGGSSTDFEPFHTYQVTDTYLVCLSVWNSLDTSCNDYSCQYLAIGSPSNCNNVSSNFGNYPDSGDVFGRQFYNYSSLNTTSYLWEFGNGITSTEKNPYYVYSDYGQYEVCLTAWSDTCEKKYCEWIDIMPPDPCQDLSPYFYSNGDSGMGMFFYNSTQGGAIGYQWEFGDGTTSTEENPHHIYSNYGWYNVCLSVTRDSCTKSWCYMVNIPNPAGCNAMFTYYQGNTQQELIFYNQSYGNFSNYLWTFSDGANSYEYNPVHKFPSTGWHRACLYVWNDTTGCQNEYCLDVYVGNQSGCYAEFYHEQDSVNNMGFYFGNNSYGGYTNIQWDFGDGTTSGDENTYHVYANYGEYSACLSISDSSGNCQHQSCHSIYIMDPSGCYAMYNFKQDEMGLGINFFNTSFGDFTSQKWTFGDGDSSNEYNPYHTYSMDGYYEVCLNVYNDSTQCYDTYCNWIYVYNMTSLCKAYFEHWYDSTGTGVNFWNSSSGDFTEFFWTFGDGTSSTEMNPHHVFSAPGSYLVCLKIGSNTTGCFDEYCYDVYIYQQSTCKANFIFNPLGNMGAQFENLSSGDYTGMMWDFGDGTTSDLKHPTHEYANKGSYLVCLKLWNDTQTCYDNYCQWVYVFDPNVCNAYFGFQLDPTGKTVYFENWSNNDSNRIWNFGDGDTTSDKSPVHTYNMEGSYNVCLTIFDDSCSDTYCSTVYIYDQNRCKAYFSFWGDSAGLGLNFNDYSSGGHNHVKWSFGDGTFSNEMNPHHIFANKGDYEVCMEIWDDNSNCFDKYCSMVFVHDPSSPCNAYFGFYPGEVGLSVNFQNWSKGGISNWKWDFGDGTSSTNDYEPIHTYLSEGAYNVCLLVTNDTIGCTDQYCAEIFIKARPECEANFHYEFADSGYGVYFANISWGNTNNWLWDFGDGSTSTESKPFHEFSSEGWYNVCLKIWSDSGNCDQTFCNTVYVFDKATLNSFYGYIPTGTIVTFMNWSTGNPVSVLWSFGDGNTSPLTSPDHEYAEYGVYNVCLTVTDSLGNSDTYCDSLAFFPVNRPSDFVNATEPIKIYPNPANPKTTIKYILAKSTRVEINIYDMLSRKIKTVVNANLDAGTHEYIWDATQLNTGLYFIEVRTSHSRNLYKVSLMK